MGRHSGKISIGLMIIIVGAAVAMVATGVMTLADLGIMLAMVVGMTLVIVPIMMSPLLIKACIHRIKEGPTPMWSLETTNPDLNILASRFDDILKRYNTFPIIEFRASGLDHRTSQRNNIEAAFVNGLARLCSVTFGIIHKDEIRKGFSKFIDTLRDDISSGENYKEYNRVACFIDRNQKEDSTNIPLCIIRIKCSVQVLSSEKSVSYAIVNVHGEACIYTDVSMAINQLKDIDGTAPPSANLTTMIVQKVDPYIFESNHSASPGAAIV